MTLGDLRRGDVEGSLLERARRGAPILLTGPPGSGKTTILRRLHRALESQGWLVVRLDLMGAASSPERFCDAALDAMPAGALQRLLPRAAEIRALAGSRDRARASQAVLRLIEMWSSLDSEGGRGVALLFDEATEIRSLAYFTGLREIASSFRDGLAHRPRATILATSYPTLAKRLFGFDAVEARPLTRDEISQALENAGARGDAEALRRATRGWPRYVDALAAELTRGASIEASWRRAFADGGSIERACRHTHESLLLRSRGYGISKAALQAVALGEGRNLTALVKSIGRTPGAVRDYLVWLIGVDALRMTRKRYHYVDSLVREWVRVHGRGVDASERDVNAALERLQVDEPAATPARRGRAPEPSPRPVVEPTRPRPDTLIEID